jgi:hypothetical protein
VTGEFKFKIGAKSMAVGFTDQRISAHAGTAAFWGWLHPSGFVDLLQRVLPHRAARSNNHLTAGEKALAFLQGILCEARRLTHVAYLRRDALMPELLGIRRIASQSSLSRFLAGFGGAGGNLRCFRPLWHWCQHRLPSRKEGYTLDLDSTRLLHEDGHQQGVAVGYTRQGLKPCLHPLIAVLAEVRLVASFWLRSGNASCGNNATAFFGDLLENLPSHIRLRGVRADAGFCLPELLDLWESVGLRYVVVARLTRPIQEILRGDLLWQPTEIGGTDVAEMSYQSSGWRQPRRLILIRHRVADKKSQSGGKMLLDVPGYLFQALVTNEGPSRDPLQVWRHYNGRADCENVIKELQQGFGLSTLICKNFFATEAALALAIVAYNLTVLFQRHLGWQTKVTIHTLRFWLFVTGGLVAKPAGQLTVKIAVPEKERRWWNDLWQKILCPHPNCHAVENRPAFA